MKERYRVIQRSDRGGGCYCVDNQTGERTSLGTRDRKEAARLVRHKNEALKNPHINRKIGMAYLAAVDPSLVTRTWSDVMANVILDKQGPIRPAGRLRQAHRNRQRFPLVARRQRPHQSSTRQSGRVSERETAPSGKGRI